MSSSTTPLDDDHLEAGPQVDATGRHAVEAADVESLSPAELAELYARAGGQQPQDSARLKEIAEIKAILELLMGALEKDAGLGDKMQEQILAVGCEIEAKVSEALAGGGTAGPDMAAVKGLLVQLVKLIEQGRAAAKKTAQAPAAPAEPVSLESDIMAEITAAEPAQAPIETLEAEQPTLDEAVLEKDEAPDPVSDSTPAPDSTPASDSDPTPDPAMDALYQSLRATEPPLLEQTAEGDIEVVAADTPPQTLPKCLTEPWDDKSPAPKDATAGAATKRGLFAPLGRMFKKASPKTS